MTPRPTTRSAPGANAVRDAIVTHELADVAGPPYDLVIHIGDVVYAFGHEKIWRDWFDAIEPISSRLPYMVGLGLGRISLCATSHPIFTILTNIFGASVSERAMRPNPGRARQPRDPGRDDGRLGGRVRRALHSAVRHAGRAHRPPRHG